MCDEAASVKSVKRQGFELVVSEFTRLITVAIFQARRQKNRAMQSLT